MHPVLSSYTTASGVQITLERFDGEVVGYDEHHVTKIHQDDLILPGQVRPGYISSSTETIRKVWLKSPAGVERQFNLSALSVQTRVGHQLTVVSGAAASRVDSMRIFAVCNRTTEQTFWNRVGGVSSGYNDRARSLWLPGVFAREWRRFAAVGAVLLALYNVRGGVALMVVGAGGGAVLGSIVWILALLFPLSPARRFELRTYPQIEEIIRDVAESPAPAA